jgi:hypothetical protein
MKRRLIGLALSLSVILGLGVATPTPALAFHAGTVCRNHNGPDGPDGVLFTICAHLNTFDFDYNLIQAKSTFSRPENVIAHSGCGGCTYDTGKVIVYFGRLELWRYRASTGGYSLVRQEAPVNRNNWNTNSWQTTPYYDLSASGGGQFSTQFDYVICFIGFPGDPCSIQYSLNTPYIQRG